MTPHNDHPRASSTRVSRRGFLEKSAILAAGTAAGLSLARSAHAAGDDVIKIGLIGCGGRGCGAAVNALGADPNTRLVAMGDAFADMLERGLKNLKTTPVADRVTVEKDRCFVGLDAYQKVLQSGVDMVLLAAPGGFRPLHLKAAIDAGKHVFCEKPMAVDGPGLRKVIAAVELAKKNKLAIRAGLCNPVRTRLSRGHAAHPRRRDRRYSGNLRHADGRLALGQVQRAAQARLGRPGMADAQLEQFPLALRRLDDGSRVP